MAEPLIAAGTLVFVGVGLGSYAYVPKDYLWVILLSLVWSQGLHVWMPLPNSMALGLAEAGYAPVVLVSLGVVVPGPASSNGNRTLSIGPYGMLPTTTVSPALDDKAPFVA